MTDDSTDFEDRIRDRLGHYCETTISQRHNTVKVSRPMADLVAVMKDVGRRPRRGQVPPLAAQAGVSTQKISTDRDQLS